MGRLLTSQVAAHTLIAETASEMAGEFYESAAHDNTFYHFYPSLDYFVKKETPRFIPVAREALAKLLSHDHISDQQKEDIYDALMLDRSLPRGRLDKIKAHRNIIY